MSGSRRTPKRLLAGALLLLVAAAACGDAGSAASAIQQRDIVSSSTDTPTITPLPPTITPQSPTLAAGPAFVTWTPTSTPLPDLGAVYRLAPVATPTEPFTPTATLAVTATATVTMTAAPSSTMTSTVSPSPVPPSPTDTLAVPTATPTQLPPPAGRCAASAGGSSGGDQNQNRLAAAPAYYQEVFSLQASGPSGSSVTTGSIDQADSTTHEVLTVPGYPPADLYVTGSGYVVSVAGGPFSFATAPPPQLSAFVSIQNGICDWLVTGYQSMTVQETGIINGTTATHVVQTWAPGRPVNVPGYSGTTDGPTTADVWYSSILNNLIVKTASTIHVATAGGPATLTYQNDLSHITERHTIAVPQAGR
ncbi:MAG TPA: hypothetical protein VK009_11620 [Chloroflexota bacterium]|nr:hypothetical protein [Chloroflexota bacterium]